MPATPRSRRFLSVLLCLFVLEGAALLIGQQPLPPAGTGDEKLLAVMHSISSHALLDDVAEMVSPKYKGRLTGTPEYDAVADWAARLLASWKIRPAGDTGSYLQRFPDPYTLVLPGASLSLSVPVGTASITRPYAFEKDFYPGSTSDSCETTAPIVYVGYGITAPELGYDDYAGVDVKGKLVLMEPEAPVGPDRGAELFGKWRPYTFHDYKSRNAARHGAAGIVYDYFIVNPNNVFIKGLCSAAVSPTVVADLFAGSGRRHDDVVKGIRTSLRPASFEIGKTMTMKNVTEHHPEGIGSNVVGWLEGSDPALKQEAIVLGAHLDHLGMNPELMPGAHDNASGVAVLLGVAKALAEGGIPLKRSVVFVLFGAEEQGVKGSEFYVAHPFLPNGKTVMLNLESVGRGEAIGAGSGENFPRLWDVVERANRKYIHRPLTASANANLARPRQDAAHFLWAGVPTISFGVYGEKPLPFPIYHTTGDDLSVMTPEIMEDLARLVFLTTVDLADGASARTPAP